MTKKRLFCEKTICGEDGVCLCVGYYLLLKQGSAWGVAVETERRGQKEWAAVEGLLLKQEHMEGLLSLLSRNNVTTCTLKEIVAELRNKF